MPVKNRFNNLSSKEWLPFQKSWFVDEGTEELYRKNVAFFTQHLPEYNPKVWYKGLAEKAMKKVCKTLGRQYTNHPEPELQFALLDLRESCPSYEDFIANRASIINECLELYDVLEHRKFLCIVVKQYWDGENYRPVAWDIGKSLATTFSLKDEKIACLENEGMQKQNTFSENNLYYCLYFRKDERSDGTKELVEPTFYPNSSGEKVGNKALSSWYVLRPPRRKPNEIVHPAKYPESLTQLFIERLTKPGDAVFDPMSGTGSTQVSALLLDRRAYGCELSNIFAEVARNRCGNTLFSESQPDHAIHCMDARDFEKVDWPIFDYVITSPPYWDMLNMKGAEGQAKRRAKGLQLNYSDDGQDLGNIEDYQAFVNELVSIYIPIINNLKKGGFITIVVKNIKKKGSNYPLAWDLAEALIKHHLKLYPEIFWCQDDINIAPYGYGNTWVSNTFHHYCLNFQKV